MIPVGVAVSVALTGWWCNSEVRRAIEQQLSNELQSMITANVTALNIWIDNQLRFVDSLASEEKIQSLALAVVDRVSKDGAAAEALREYEEVQVLQDYVGPRLQAMRLGFVIIDPEGIIISAPFHGMLGDQLHDEALETFRYIFDTEESVLLTPYKPPRPDPRQMRAGVKGGFGPGEDPRFGGGPGRRGGRRRNRTIMAVAAPIRGTDGSVAAAIGLMIQPEREFTRILSVARSGETGETFAFDQNGVMLSQSRFEGMLQGLGLINDSGPRGSSALNLELRDPGGNLVGGYEPRTPHESWPLTKLVQDAVAGGNGIDVKGFRDYRGVPVVGAWRWLPKYRFGVATKLDAAEAFQPLRVLRLVFLILLLLSVLCGVGLFLFSYFNVMLRRQMEDVALEAKELGQYTLEKKIGEGGMGAVYRARHALLRRDTAVKLLLPEKADAMSIRRFEREVQLTCRLVHPNTIQIFDYGHTPDGIFYYAMEFLDGINLRELIQLEGRLQEGRVIHILEQICASLSEAHETGLVHRDIKPANIIVCDRGGLADMVKVLDFGLVKSCCDDKATSTEATHAFTIAGTPQFIAPEAVSRPDRVDQRSDLYAVGLLAYYLLTGGHVFDGESAFEVMQEHASKTPEPPRERLGTSVDPTLENLILQCLEKKPVNRPASARAMVAALHQSSAHGKWTSKEREDWWVAFRARQGERPKAGAPKSSTILEPTLQINLGERTRVAG